MKTIKIIAILMAGLFTLSSCGIIIINDGRVPETSQTEEVTTPEEEITYIPPEYPIIPSVDLEKAASDRVKALPDADLDGLGVIIAVEKEGGDFFNDETGAYVNQVVYRNSLVSQKYDTNIITIHKNAVDIHTDIRIAKMNGDYFADFVVIGGTYLGAYDAANYIINMKALPFTDYSKPYYNKEGIDQLSVGNVIYGVVGSATEAPNQLGCLYFNKTLAEKYGIKLDYRQIYENEFTWDVYFEYLNAVDEDGIAFVSSYDDSSLALSSFMGANKTFLTKTDGYFVPDFVNDTSRSIISYVKNLISKRTSSIEKTVITVNENGEKLETIVKINGFNIFGTGEVLSAFGNVGNMPSLKNAGFSWEILPLPMVEGQESYASSTPTTAPIVSFLSSSPNIDTCGYVLEGLFAASQGYFKGKVIEDAMKNCMTGVYTPDMLELVLENPVYDFAYAFSSASDALKAGTSTVFLNAFNGNKDIADYYTTKIKNNLENFLNSFKP